MPHISSAVDLLVLTFNCAKNLINVAVFAAHLKTALERGDTGGLPEIVVFSLQEVAPMSYGFIGDYFTAPYIQRFDEALNIAASRLSPGDLLAAAAAAAASQSPSPPSPDFKTKTPPAKRKKPPPHYTLVQARNVGYTALLLFARDPEAVRDLQLAEVGFGAADMGNKGAVGARFTYIPSGADNGTEMTFVATHLAAMEWSLPTRNANWAAIMRGLTFGNPAEILRPEKSPWKKKKVEAAPPGTDTGSGSPGDDRGERSPLLPPQPKSPSPSPPPSPDPHSASVQRRLHSVSVFKPSSHLFVAGDLNYRISTTSPPPLAAFPSLDPDDDENYYPHFLPLDQLTLERLAGRTMHGLTEADVRFPPTYKYAVLPQEGPLALTADGEPEEPREVREQVPWVFAPHRWPGWTDRILFLEIPPWFRRRRRLTFRRLHNRDDDDEADDVLGRITVVAYDALPVVRSSDHRPVFLRARVPMICPDELSPPGFAEDPSGHALPPHADDAADPRMRLPVEVDPEAWERRAAARRREVLAGWTMWASTTKEGAGVIAGTLLLAVLVWWALKAAGGGEL